MNSRQFFKSFGKEAAVKIYLFIGEEEGEKERALSMILSSFPKGQKIGRFHAESGEIVAAAEVLLQQDMFSEAKVSVIYGAEKLIKKTDITLINEILDSDSSGTIILMSSSSTVPAYMKKRKDFAEVMFWRMFESDLHSYGAERFREAGRFASKDVLAAITSLTGRDFAKFDAAVDKILAYNDSKNIAVETVVAVVADEKEVKIFDFINSLFLGKKDALYLLSKVLGSGMHELQIFAFIWKEAERIEKYVSLKKSGMSDLDIADSIGVSASGKDEFLMRARRFDEAKIRRIFISLGNADSAVKGGQIASDHETIVLNPLVEIVEAALF